MKTTTHNPLTAVIIDDDPTMVAVISNYIVQITKLNLIGTYTNPTHAAANILAGPHIDFLFLDIKMEISGLQIAQVLRDRVEHIVFITAYKEYALEAFKLHCDHYLVKPVDFPKFLSAVNDILKRKYRQADKLPRKL